MSCLLAAALAAGLVVPAAARAAKGASCPEFVRQDMDDLDKRFVKLGAKGRIVAVTCNERGNLSELTIQRLSDNHITRWKPRDGLTALVDRVMAGQ